MDMFKKQQTMLMGLVLAIILSAVAGSLYYYFGQEKNELTAVDIAPARLFFQTEQVTASGTVQTLEYFFEIDGVIKEMGIEEGQEIERGTVIAVLESDEIDAEIDTLELALESENSVLAELELQVSQNEYRVQSEKIAEIELDIQNTSDDLVDELSEMYSAAQQSFTEYIDIYYGDLDKPNPSVNIPGMVVTFTKETNLRNERLGVRSIMKDQKNDITISDIDKIKQDLSSFISFAIFFKETVQSSSEPEVISNSLDIGKNLVRLEDSIDFNISELEALNSDLQEAKTVLETIPKDEENRQKYNDQNILVDQIQADLIAKQEEKQKYLIIAANEGRVLSIDVSVGELVQSGQSAITIFAIGGSSETKAVVQ